ncbi:MAG: hypothetical protein WC341_16090, partial [Bacteroidales bacterium]
NHPVFTQRGFINAENITKADWLGMPVRKITHETTFIQLETSPNRKQGGGNKGFANGAKIELDNKFGFSLGYYLAEGSLHTRTNTLSEIVLTHHDKDCALGDRAIEGFTPYIKSHTRKKVPNTLTTQEYLYGSNLAKWILKTVGSKGNKCIPDWFFDCGEDFLRGVFCGYLSGDGSRSNGKQKEIVLSALSVTTVCSSLALQVRDIAASLGLGWGAIDIRKAGIYYGRNCRETFLLRWAGKSARNIRELLGYENVNNSQARSEKSRIEDGFVWVKIKSITHTKVKEVYDIEVNHSDHSFRTISFSVKNSEVGFWKKTENRTPEDLVQALRAGVPSEPNTLVVMESTAKGVGNFWHNEWMSGINGESGYECVFVSWWEIEMYQEEVKNLAKFVEEMTDTDWVLWEKGATLEGINWYKKFKYREGYSDWRMQSEFPSDWMEAFQSTGRRAFAPMYVVRCRKNCRQPYMKGELFADDVKGMGAFKNIHFEQTPGGSLWVWQPPDHTIKVANRYALFGDIGGRTLKADRSAIRVIDRYWMIEQEAPEMVATWHGILDQDIFAWKGAQLAYWYCKGLYAVETQSLRKTKDENFEGDHFLTILDEIVNYYDNLYIRNSLDSVRAGIPAKYGFHTNRSTKPMIIDQMNSGMRDELYIERDQRACDEADSYEVKPDGSYGAVDGSHDDLVVATAGVVWLALKYMDAPYLIKEQKKIIRRGPVTAAEF